ncbi:hypothetical protein, partial [Clostridium tarantellae]|uniref:hypothetical protein n=1 Tax=Clostridium tarantellae TaxID=39493 RepID=UPI00128E453B
IRTEVTIDVRTKTEYKLMPLFSCNIPIINEKQHKIIKKFYPLAFFIIFLGIYKNKNFIKETLINLSNNKKNKIIFGCSRGRLRSPMMYFYAKYLGIDCKVLYKGIKGVLHDKEL